MHEHTTQTKIEAVLSDNSHSTILIHKQQVINTEVVRVFRLNENSFGSEMETCDFIPKCLLEDDGSCRNLNPHPVCM